MAENRDIIEQIKDLAPLVDIDETFLRGWQANLILDADGRVTESWLTAPNGE
jgi:hypothetical protein